MKSIVYIFMAFMTLVLVQSCNESGEKAPLAKEEREALRREDSAAFKVAVLPTTDCLPVIVAKELRLFDTLGVDVHLRHYNALSECRIALAHEMVEAACIDSTLLRMLQGEKTGGTSKEANVKTLPLIAGPSTDLTWQLLTSKKSRITRTAQLADRVIAADSHGESYRLASLTTDSLTRKGQHVFIVQIEDVRVRMDMLNNGNIDAALLPEPFATKARKEGAKVLKEVHSTPKGVIALRADVLKDKNRKKQYDLFCKALKIANDSIRKYGVGRYSNL